MLTLVTNNFQAAWSRRSAELEQRRLNQYRDVLLEYLAEECQSKISNIITSLLARCTIGDGPDQLYTVIWTYRDMVPHNQDGSVRRTFEETNEKCSNIYVDELLNPHHDETDEEDIHTRETVLYPQRTDVVLRRTSVLPLLSGRFGNNYWVRRCVNQHADVPEPNPEDAWRIVEYQLRLEFYPRGLPKSLGKKIMDARADRGHVYITPPRCETIVTNSN